MKTSEDFSIDWKQAIKIGLADSVVWVWFIQTAYTSLFTQQLGSVSYFLPENSWYSILACLVISGILVSTKWDSIPRLYRGACSIGCSVSVLALITAYRYRLRKGVYFAIMSIIWMLGSFLGAAVIYAFPDIPDFVFAILATLMGIAIAISFIANQNVWIKSGSGGKDRTDRIDIIANEYGLTKRETEVFHLLMGGRSIPYIQDALYISEGTARTHTRHIYAKLGVHSRQELLDILTNY